MSWSASAPCISGAAAAESNLDDPVAPGTRCQVAVPLADLRREPSPAAAQPEATGRYPVDPRQETQVLFCEQVVVRSLRGRWAQVEAVEQRRYAEGHGWQGYPGWLPRRVLAPKLAGFDANAVVISPYADLYDGPGQGRAGGLAPFAARVQIDQWNADWVRARCPGGTAGWLRRGDVRLFDALPRDNNARRRAIVRDARRFLGQPYLWGGRSPHTDRITGQATGVDCSGLVHLAYRVNGIDIPRDAHDQYRRSRPIRASSIQAGDLVFLARVETPDRIYHVLLSAGDDRAVEAVGEPNSVRAITFAQRLGTPLRALDASGRAGGLVVRIGRLLPD